MDAGLENEHKKNPHRKLTFLTLIMLFCVNCHKQQVESPDYRKSKFRRLLKRLCNRSNGSTGVSSPMEQSHDVELA